MSIKQHIVFKISVITLILAFIFENIVWANPDIFQNKPHANSLQVQSPFKPIASPHLLNEIRMESVIRAAISYFGGLDKANTRVFPKLAGIQYVLPFNGKQEIPGSDNILIPDCSLSYGEHPPWKYDVVVRPDGSVTELRKPSEAEVTKPTPDDAIQVFHGIPSSRDGHYKTTTSPFAGTPAQEASENEGPFRFDDFVYTHSPDLSSVTWEEYRDAKAIVFNIFSYIYRHELCEIGADTNTIRKAYPKLSDRKFASLLPTAICYDDGHIEINSNFIRLIALLKKKNLHTIPIKDRDRDREAKLLKSIIYSLALHEIRGHYILGKDGGIDEFRADEYEAQIERGYKHQRINVAAMLFYWLCVCEGRSEHEAVEKRVLAFLNEIDEASGESYGEILGFLKQNAIEKLARKVAYLADAAREKGYLPDRDKYVAVEREKLPSDISDTETRQYAMNEGDVGITGGESGTPLVEREEVLDTIKLNKQQIITGIEPNLVELFWGLNFDKQTEVFEPNLDDILQRLELTTATHDIPTNRRKLIDYILRELKKNFAKHVRSVNENYDFSLTLQVIQRGQRKGVRIISESEGPPIDFETVLTGKNVSYESEHDYVSPVLHGVFLLKLSRIAQAYKGVELELESGGEAKGFSYAAETRAQKKTHQNKIIATVFEEEQESLTRRDTKGRKAGGNFNILLMVGLGFIATIAVTLMIIFGPEIIALFSSSENAGAVMASVPFLPIVAVAPQVFIALLAVGLVILLVTRFRKKLFQSIWEHKFFIIGELLALSAFLGVAYWAFSFFAWQPGAYVFIFAVGTLLFSNLFFRLEELINWWRFLKQAREMDFRAQRDKELKKMQKPSKRPIAEPDIQKTQNSDRTDVPEQEEDAPNVRGGRSLLTESVRVTEFDPKKSPKFTEDISVQLKQAHWRTRLESSSVCLQASIGGSGEVVGVAVAGQVGDFTEEDALDNQWDRHLNPKLTFAIYVGKGYRGRGIGLALYNAVMDYARSNGYKLVGGLRQCGGESNQLIEFLKKEGFTISNLPGRNDREVAWRELSKKPAVKSVAAQVEPFLYDLSEPELLSQSFKEAIISSILSGKKVAILASRKLSGFRDRNATVLDALETWRERMKIKCPRMAHLLDNNLVTGAFDTRDELNEVLAGLGLDLNDKDHNFIFTFAPVNEIESLRYTEKAIRQVYMLEDKEDKNGKFPAEEYYFPFLDIITISIVKALVSYDAKDIERIFTNMGTGLAETLNIESIDDKDPAAFLIFTLVPNAKAYEHDWEQVSRYARLLRFLRST